MPRTARIDVPGQVYHVISRGIERRELFYKEEDYLDFTARLSTWLAQTGAKCLAWCLMPNHFHLLVLRGDRPLSERMHHVMTGYAVSFNLRHQRAGHLFQNRYKAMICSMDEYFMELVPYIHLNPLRANLVKDLAGLEGYKWCGHRAAMGGGKDGVLQRDILLARFGDTEPEAVRKYLSAMVEKAESMTGRDMSGAGMPRDFGGEAASFDQRVLGGSDFLESVLRAAGEKMGRVKKGREEVLAAVEAATGVSRSDIMRRTRERGPARARAIFCYLCREECGICCTELAREMGICQSAVSKLASKGRFLAESAKIVI